MHKLLRYIFAAVIVMTASVVTSRAQFREEAFSQSYVDNADSTASDSTDVMFSFKEYFGGLKHTRDARIGVLAAGSTFIIGGNQIYNKQYWKLPVIYGGIGAGITGGIIYRQKWHKTGGEQYRQMSNWFYAGAGLVWWGSLMDGAVNYKKDVPGQAGKATLYSLLLPGLGQAYNGEYWKIPIYYGAILGSVHFYATNKKSYERYKWIYESASATDGSYDGPISASTALYYRNMYRRYRDYSVLAIAGFYLLQVIDANVFSYMRDFDLSDDISMRVGPSVITERPAYTPNPYSYAFHTPSSYNGHGMGNGVGLRMGLTF